MEELAEGRSVFEEKIRDSLLFKQVNCQHLNLRNFTAVLMVNDCPSDQLYY